MHVGVGVYVPEGWVCVIELQREATRRGLASFWGI